MAHRLLPRARGRVTAGLQAFGATLLLVCAVLASAQDLPLDAVARGDVGYGVTEAADGLRRFDVEVLGVRAPSGPGVPTLLIRTSGDFLDDVGGVAAGMSGSPIYLGEPGAERLVGALAYAFPNSDHRLALVTPIAAMRALVGDEGGPPFPPGGAAPLSPSPLLLAGASARGSALLAPALGRLGADVMPVQAGATSGAADRSGPLVPGDAVAVTLIRGELTVAAIGTVTDVTGDRALLLGHPLLRAGVTDLAVYAADVPAIVANRTLPFKLADVIPGEPIGTVVRDGQAGLAAELDRVPDDLPVVVRVDGPTGTRTVAARIARLPGVTPALLALTVQETVDALRDRIGGGGAEIAWQIELADEPPLRILDQVASADDLALDAARRSATPLTILLENPFRAPELVRVAVRVELSDAREHAELVEIALETPETEPGGTVQAFVRVQPFRGEARVLTLAVPIPDDAPPGELVLTVRGASVPDPRWEDLDPPAADPYEQATSGLPPLLSWAELLGALEARPQARELVVEIPGETRPRRLARRDVGGVVTGLERVTVRVVDPNASDAEADGTADVAASDEEERSP